MAITKSDDGKVWKLEVDDRIDHECDVEWFRLEVSGGNVGDELVVFDSTGTFNIAPSVVASANWIDDIPYFGRVSAIVVDTMPTKGHLYVHFKEPMLL